MCEMCRALKGRGKDLSPLVSELIDVIVEHSEMMLTEMNIIRVKLRTSGKYTDDQLTTITMLMWSRMIYTGLIEFPELILEKNVKHAITTASEMIAREVLKAGNVCEGMPDAQVDALGELGKKTDIKA